MPLITREPSKDAEYAIIGEWHYHPTIRKLELCVRRLAEKEDAELTQYDVVDACIMKIAANYARFVFEQEVEVIKRNKDRFDTIYMEGVRDDLNVYPTTLTELFKGKTLSFLDEGVKAAEKSSRAAIKAANEGMLCDSEHRTYGPWHFYNNYLQRQREKAWAKRMDKEGPGIAVMGTAHAERTAKRLEGYGKKAEVIMDLFPEKRAYEKKGDARQLLEEAKATLAENIRAHWPENAPKVEKLFESLPKRNAAFPSRRFSINGTINSI
jgi:hypothetical protein